MKSREDHGYVLDLGILNVSGFLSFKDAERERSNDGRQLYIGSLLDITINKVSGNGRICNAGVAPATFASSHVSTPLESSLFDVHTPPPTIDLRDFLSSFYASRDFGSGPHYFCSLKRS